MGRPDGNRIQPYRLRYRTRARARAPSPTSTSIGPSSEHLPMQRHDDVSDGRRRDRACVLGSSVPRARRRTAVSPIRPSKSSLRPPVSSMPFHLRVLQVSEREHNHTNRKGIDQFMPRNSNENVAQVHARLGTAVKRRIGIEPGRLEMSDGVSRGPRQEGVSVTASNTSGASWLQERRGACDLCSGVSLRSHSSWIASLAWVACVRSAATWKQRHVARCRTNLSLVPPCVRASQRSSSPSAPQPCRSLSTLSLSPLSQCFLRIFSLSICLDLSGLLCSLSRSLSLCSLPLLFPSPYLSIFFLLCVFSLDLFLGPLSGWVGTNQGVVWNPSFVRYLS